MLDTFYITILNHYKKRYGRKSLTIASVYINFLSVTIFIALGAFFKAFLNQMNLLTVSTTKFTVVVILGSIMVLFRNWMYYTGKKRTILNAKYSAKRPSIILAWFLPLAGLLLAYIFIQIQ